MLKSTFPLLPIFALLVSCGSNSPQPYAQQPMPVTAQSGQPAPPVAEGSSPVVAVQPYPAAAQPPAPEPPPNAERVAPPDAQMPVADVPDQRAEIVIPSGTPIHVRLNQTLDTRRNRSGDRFTATLTSPVEDNGRVLVPRGSTFTGHVTVAQPSGRMEGRAVLGVTLDSFEINGARHPVVTSRASRVSAKHKKRNLALIGGGSGLGALIGGLAGGGKGALIGAGAGAGAGVAGAELTGKMQVALPAESLLTFRLEEAAEL